MRYSMQMKHIVLAILFLLGYPMILNAQDFEESPSDTLSYIAMEADTMLHSEYESVDTLIKNVILTQDSLVMFCEKATVIDQIYAKAYYNVVIIHHDTTQIYADSMYYDGVAKIAELYGEVILQDGKQRLFTNKLIYHTEDKYSYYLEGGTIISEGDTIVSKKGHYYQREKKVRLSDKVTFTDSSRVLRTDSILYFYDRDELNIIAPTVIERDSIDIYCEDGIYRLKTNRGVLSREVQVKSGDQIITSQILDVRGEEGKYTFLIDPLIIDSSGTADGDTIIYFSNEERIEIIGHAVYQSDDEVVRAPKILYDLKTKEYQTVGSARIRNGDNTIVAGEIKNDAQGGTLLYNGVVIEDNEGKIKIESDFAEKNENRTKIYSDGEQPLLTYALEANNLLLRGDTLISQTVTDTLIKLVQDTGGQHAIDTLSLPSIDTLTSDSLSVSDSISDVTEMSTQTREELVAINNVILRNGDTYGKSRGFNFNQQDSIITLTGDPILWSDSTQLTADTIKIYLKNNAVLKIVQSGNAMIVTPDSLEGFNQIKGLIITNYLTDNDISKSLVSGNAELLYLVIEEGVHEAINYTSSKKMTFNFDLGSIQSMNTIGLQDSNMYEYNEGDILSSYYLDGFRWRLEEKPQENAFYNLLKALSK